MKTMKWVWLSFAFLTLTYSTILVLGFNAFEIGGLDLANYSQTIWKISNGLPPVMSAVGTHALSVHFSLIWYWLALIFKIMPAIPWLLILHVVFIAALGIAIFSIASYVTQDQKVSFLLFLAFCFSQYTQRVLLSPIHPESFYGLLVGLALFFMLREKLLLYFLFFSLALTSNEDVGLYFVFVGVYLFLKEKRKIAGLTTIFVPLIYLAIVMKIKPFFGPDTQGLLGRFANLGGSAGEILKNLLFNPKLVMTCLLEKHKIEAVSQLLGLVCFLPFFSLWGLGMVTVPILFKMLTNHAAMNRFWDHYSMAILPFLWLGTVFGIRELLLGRFGWIKNPRKFVLAAVWIILIANIIVQANLPYSPLSIRFEWKRLCNTAHAQVGWELIRKIPANASVLTQERLASAVALRTNLYVIHQPSHVEDGIPLWQPDYVFFDCSRFKDDWLEQPLRTAADYFAHSPTYEIVDENDGWLLLRRKKV